MENSPISFSFQFFQTPLKRILNSKVFFLPILFSIIHLHVGEIGAQTTNLFTLSSLADSQLTSSQYLIKQSYQSRESVASIQSVNLASPAVIQHLTTITFKFRAIQLPTHFRLLIEKPIQMVITFGMEI